MFLEKFKYIFLFLEWNKRSGGMSKLLIDWWKTQITFKK